MLMNIVKGFLIGIALVVPGLSGSIFAVVVGVYEPLLTSVNHFRSDVRRHTRFLAPIALGVVLGILASTKLVLYLTEAFPILAYAFFTGLVLGVVPFVVKKMRQIRFNPLYLLLSAGGFIVIWLLSQMGEPASTTTIAIRQVSSVGDVGMLLFAGLFSVSLMAIPGISGSIMLMVINQYGTVYHAVSQLTDAAGLLLRGNGQGWAMIGQGLLVLAPFIVGAAVGLILIAKLMEWLLKLFPAQVYYTVFGVVLAATAILLQTGIFPPFANLAGSQLALQIGLASVLTVFGILSALFFDKPEETVVEEERHSIA
ncbi:DUF368 domain-containing protein [Schleiferilactobacillus shenzhenensis]|uniref:DUF368 domain-containing protein n=1 Tax=Schleiferilactobacillus shenzhenensis LY-73 TaxID=1231336 RepID=U4TPS9_9LACO|nr:DUF368 domain-containing protein [Schleiferilactobacillus shenzhenensis]ERL65450.1 hypothetical protein L248_2523 [Schleiferilactobacillus shenzhenensis LY-73]